jgi:hypothetical protein
MLYHGVERCGQIGLEWIGLDWIWGRIWIWRACRSSDLARLAESLEAARGGGVVRGAVGRTKSWAVQRHAPLSRYRDKLSPEETEGFFGFATLASDHHGFGMCGTVGHLDNQRLSGGITGHRIQPWH